MDYANGNDMEMMVRGSLLRVNKFSSMFADL